MSKIFEILGMLFVALIGLFVAKKSYGYAKQGYNKGKTMIQELKAKKAMKKEASPTVPAQ